MNIHLAKEILNIILLYNWNLYFLKFLLVILYSIFNVSLEFVCLIVLLLNNWNKKINTLNNFVLLNFVVLKKMKKFRNLFCL